MKPTVGRIVHYTNLGDRAGKYPPEAQAALITKVTPLEGVELHRRVSPLLAAALPTEEAAYAVSLRVFYEDGDFSMRDVPFTPEKAGTDSARGKWTWPEVQR